MASKLYNPFGVVLEQYGTSQTTYGYTGEQFNSTSGLLYLRARYYNPNLRVFSAKDPFAGNMQNPATLHGYSYTHNNPVLYTDPTGKYIESPLDLAFILFDIGSLSYNLYHGYTAQTHADRVYYSNQASIDVVALAIDFGMLGTPGATGGGMAYRGVQLAAAGGKTINIVVDCSKLARVAREAQLGLKGSQIFPHILLAQSGSGSGGGGGSSSSSGGNRNILMDEHPTLSNDAADMALQGPPNTTPRVKGAGGADADIEFVDNLGNVILRREVKVHTGDLSSLSRRVSKGASQVHFNGEVFIQISSSIDVPTFLSHFSKYRADLTKYQNVIITFVDESAQVLYSGKITP